MYFLINTFTREIIIVVRSAIYKKLLYIIPPFQQHKSLIMRKVITMNLSSKFLKICFFTMFMVFLIGGYSSNSYLLAQSEPKSEESFFFSDSKKIPITIVLDQLGVVARDDISSNQLQEFVSRFHLKLVREYPQGIFIFGLPQPLSRQEIVKLARTVRREGTKLIKYAGFTATPHEAETPFIVTDEFIAKFKPDTTREQIDSFNKDHGVEIIMSDRFAKNQFLLWVTENSPLDALDMSNRYQESGSIEFSHPNFVRVIIFRQFIPDDPLFANQWHHQNTGQAAGTVDADADTPLAWNITQGAAGTIIAVIDNGFDIGHPDLTPNLWVNAGEIPDGIDNDGNSFVDDINGFDFRGNDGNPSPGVGDNHGTAVAGVVGARGNNALGVSGSCPNCSLMLIRSGDTVFQDSQAFGYAQQMGAQVITNSWGYSIGTPATTNVVNAINTAATNGRGGLGCVILFAMNNPNVNDCMGANPDISSLVNVIAVSRSTNRDQFDFSGFGNCMDLLAPTAGCNTVTSGRGTLWITTTDRQGAAGYNNNNPSSAPCLCPSTDPSPPPANARDYTFCFNGTSAATPLTAGVAGLALTVNNTMTRLQIQRLLQDTCDKIEDSTASYAPNTGFSSPGTGIATHGWGRINAFEAVRVAAPVAQGGRGGVDIFIRDNRLDWGNTEQPSNTLFEPTRGYIPHWESVDIKVDAPPYQAAPTTSAAFDALIDENPISGQVNQVYVRVRNRGTVTASSVTVKLHWAFAGAGLPALPNDFWTAFPSDSSNTAQVHPLGTQTIANLAYSGSSVAGTTADAAQIVQYNFSGPPVDPTQPYPNHFCLFTVIDSAQDPVTPVSRTNFVIDSITPTDNNVTHRNVRVEDTTTGRSFSERLFVRNPTNKSVQALLKLEAPEGWKIKLDGLNFNKPFKLKPMQEILVTMKIIAPKLNTTGEVKVLQEILIDKQKVISGMTYTFKPKEIKPPKASRYASLNGLSLVGDPHTASLVGYLGDGTGFGVKQGDTFSFTPIQLPHGAEIKGLKCVVMDNTPSGYIQITLNRGPINVTDPIVPMQLIASASTFPATVNPDFQEVYGTVAPSLAVVDNSKYGYFFRVDFLDSPGILGSDITLKLRGCSVEYVE